MWQLLGFGEVGTPARHYAVVDDTGRVRWAGENVHHAMAYILDHGVLPRMERDAGGGHFVREAEPADDNPGSLSPADAKALREASLRLPEPEHCRDAAPSDPPKSPK